MLMDFVVHDNAEREVIRDYISRLPQGKTYDVSIKLHRAKRSTEANALYWKWIGIIASETGNDREVCHKFFAKKFLGYDTKEFGNEKIAIVKSTATLDTAQFAEYMNQVEAFASTELGIVLPTPNDQLYSMMSYE